jgi:hypothetical protein
VSMARRQPKM